MLSISSDSNMLVKLLLILVTSKHLFICCYCYLFTFVVVTEFCLLNIYINVLRKKVQFSLIWLPSFRDSSLQIII